jgi:hypothetical protein
VGTDAALKIRQIPDLIAIGDLPECSDELL